MFWIRFQIIPKNKLFLSYKNEKTQDYQLFCFYNVKQLQSNIYIKKKE